MRLLLVKDSGEQIEARCDRCRYWDHSYCDNLVMPAGYDNLNMQTEPDFGCRLFEAKDDNDATR